MPVYLTPGVYVEEVHGSTQLQSPAWSPTDGATADDSAQILLVGPGAVAFIGMTERAPVARNGTSLTAMPVAVEGWEQYVDRFGGCLNSAYLPNAVRGFFANGGRRGYIVSLAAVEPGADPPMFSVSDFHGDHDRRTGMAGLAPLHDVTAICAPDLMVCLERGSWRREDVLGIQETLIAFSESLGSCTALLDTPPGLVPSAATRWRRETGFDRAHAALYYPWIYAGADPDPVLKVPPSGHVAGVLMRTYETHGPHATSANQALADAVDLETRISPAEQDILNPVGVNVLRVFPDATVRIWGARTLSDDPALRLLQDRMLIQAIARSIKQGATWAIFRRDDAKLREDICFALYGFLREL
jgi:Bacteriophage tail sheath protein